MKTVRRIVPSVLALGAAALAGCAERDPIWDEPPTPAGILGLSDAAVIIDPNAARALVMTVDQNLDLSPTSVPIGDGFATAAVTADQSKLLTLSRGVVPHQLLEDDLPRLTVVHGGASPDIDRLYALTDPLSGLAVDQLGEFAVVYTAPGDAEFVTNPNELVIVDITRDTAADNPMPVTLRSFGGMPQRFTFTPELGLPGGSSRLLVVETDRDIGILDLGDLEAGDVTVKLSSTGAVRSPAQVVVSEGDPASADDARLAIRLANEPSVIFVDLLPNPDEGRAFAPTPNEVFVGGIPSDVSFVQTDGGIRLAALVPEKSVLTLADPITGLTSDIDLDTPYDHLSLVTDIVGSDSGADVALLWSSSYAKVAFVALGGAVGQPYRSVDELELEGPVSQVLNVPAPNDRRKILSLSGTLTYAVLDLLDRTESPIVAAGGSSLTVAPDGERAWVVAQSAPDVAKLDLQTLHPQNLVLANPVTAAIDVARQGGGRALVAVHVIGDVSATVVDGDAPSLESSKEFLGLMLGGVQ